MTFCSHCELPITGEGVPGEGVPGDDAQSDGDPACYCCYGCRMAAEVLGELGEADEPADGQRALLYRFFLGALLAAFTMALSLAISTGYGFGAMSRLETGFDPAHWALLFAAVPALVLLGAPLARAAWADLRRRRLTLSVLFALGTGSAVAVSAVSYVRGTGPIYLETATMLLALHALGRYLTARAKGRATRVLRRLLKVPQTTYERLGPDAGAVAPEALRVGDRVRLRAGDTVPVDGRIEEGQSYVDERSLTGEARPAARQPGSSVYAGTQVLDGALLIRVTAIAEDRRLARIEATVRRALRRPSRLAQATDRIMRWLIPGAVALALATFGAWYVVAGFEKALYASLSVVLITCPCALSLAVPLSLVVALDRAARRGLVVRSGEALLAIGRAQAFLFDKTGTLSVPDAASLRVLTPALEAAGVAAASTADQVARRDEAPADDWLRMAAAVEAGARHPLAEAVQRAAASKALPPLDARDVCAVPGAGVAGTVQTNSGAPLRVGVGSARLAQALEANLPPAVRALAEEQEASGRSAHFVFAGSEAVAVLALEEGARPEAARALARLREGGADVRVLTGDRPEAARRLAGALGVPAESQRSPEEKVAFVKQVQATRGPVVMIGDGLNDAAALAEADVGVALRGGAGQALEAADAVLYNPDLGGVAWLRDLARRTRRVIRQNLAWTFGYNAAGLALAALGLLHPLAAVAIMTLSSLFVTWNALRLRRS